MSMYVTPQKYRASGFGADLDGIEDSDLATVLVRASNIANAFCAVPQVPKPFTFLGDEIDVDHPEQHSWRLPENDFDIGQRRVYFYHWPMKAMIRFRIKVTNTQYVEIAPSELFINNTDRYIEVISLAFTGVGLFGAIMPSLGLMRPVAEIAYTYGWDFSVKGEMLYVTDGQTYQGENQWWSTSVVPVVYVNGSAANPSSYSIDYTEGTVVFSAPLAATDVVTADYNHRLPANVRDAVGEIATWLLGQSDNAKRGMAGLDRLSLAEVTLVRRGSGRSGSPQQLASVISKEVPVAAELLSSFINITIRI